MAWTLSFTVVSISLISILSSLLIIHLFCIWVFLLQTHWDMSKGIHFHQEYTGSLFCRYWSLFMFYAILCSTVGKSRILNHDDSILPDCFDICSFFDTLKATSNKRRNRNKAHIMLSIQTLRDKKWETRQKQNIDHRKSDRIQVNVELMITTEFFYLLTKAFWKRSMKTSLSDDQ